MNHYAKFFIGSMALWFTIHAGGVWWMGLHGYATEYAFLVNSAMPFVLATYLVVSHIWFDRWLRRRKEKDDSRHSV